MDAIVFIILQIFLTTRAIFKIGEYSRTFPSFSWGIFGQMTRLDQSRASEKIWSILNNNSLHLARKYINMLFAGWDLKMLPEAAGRGQHFQDFGHSFSLYGPILSRQITYLLFPCDKLADNRVYETLLLNWFTCRQQTIAKIKSNERTSE